ncbi:sulfite exporter TauE/SafE family protein [Pseudalkalibacillus hwajinpoensis]|uniref:sulfite exporter TauE/SafE family protein n=1 Tax=Guptibacillus hwajinpoensis TaxID=208199 RepID=UPI001CD35EB8|nr:sulfite exporter TauE/SafE family protein [Pseudalkalibacillus hwajinpoensis]MCA0991923.1 sulfite exporter TauE/SafE family protein [Pseudalkalibacillus hwajinpoensis]
MDIGIGVLILIIGILAGGYGTIVGAGGGFIFVPALLLIFQMNPVLASSTGMVIVLINSLSGVIGYARQNLIDYKTGLTIGISALPGSILGVWFLHRYSSQYFYVIFATILVALGVFLFSKTLNRSPKIPPTLLEKEESDESDGVGHPSFNWFIPLGITMGILSSYLGIGGGWLLVPILIYVFKLSTHHATATSIFSLCLYSSVGVLSQFFYGSIDWVSVMWGGSGVIIGAQLGVILSQRIPGKIIIQMLSVLLVIIGVRLFFN